MQSNEISPPSPATPPVIRPCDDDDLDAMLAIINAGAEAYRGIIPADRWHEPYMPEAELGAEIAGGVRFIGYEVNGALLGVMGSQSVRNVELIRHAYTHSSWQGRGIGSALLTHLRARTTRPILIGTWAAASWAVRFYQRHGFTLAPEEAKARLLRTYWTIPDRQVETSVVLAQPTLTMAAAHDLVARADGA